MFCLCSCVGPSCVYDWSLGYFCVFFIAFAIFGFALVVVSFVPVVYVVPRVCLCLLEMFHVIVLVHAFVLPLFVFSLLGRVHVCPCVGFSFSCMSLFVFLLS